MSRVSGRARRLHARRPRGEAARAIAVLAAVAGCLATPASPAAAQSDPCPNAEYRVGLSAHLPDCRAYEKVSPAYKGNGEIAGGLTLPSAFRATPDGRRILYPADSVFLGAPAFPQINGYFADRGAAGWASRSVSALLPYNVNPSVLPTGMVNTDTQPFGLSPDGRKTVAVTDRDPVTGGAIPKQPYRIDLVSGDVERMAPDAVAGDPSVPLSTGGANIGFGIAGDHTFANVYYSSLAQLTPDSVAPGISAADAKLYRYADGESLLASYLPDGTPTKGIMVDSANDPVGSNSVSADGQVYWFTQGTQQPDRRLFRGVAGVQGSTLVSASEATPPGPADGATFGGASADG
ncbi:MAG: hypothetical protein GXY03_03100, partial [Solirubrobacterales bacterium]|nr:hypothetical protein [Solirubrobacterales bacterium]